MSRLPQPRSRLPSSVQRVTATEPLRQTQQKFFPPSATQDAAKKARRRSVKTLTQPVSNRYSARPLPRGRPTTRPLASIASGGGNGRQPVIAGRRLASQSGSLASARKRLTGLSDHSVVSVGSNEDQLGDMHKALAELQSENAEIVKASIVKENELLQRDLVVSRCQMEVSRKEGDMMRLQANISQLEIERDTITSTADMTLNALRFEMESKVTQLDTVASHQKVELEMKAREVETLNNSLAETKLLLNEKVMNLTKSQAIVNELNGAIESMRNAQQLEMTKLNNQLKAEVVKFEGSISLLEASNKSAVEENQILQVQLSEAQAKNVQFSFEVHELTCSLAASQDANATCERLIRTMHNKIEDLKGNIRVCVRLRSILPTELSLPIQIYNVPDRQGDSMTLEMVRDGKMSMCPGKMHTAPPHQTKKYKFNRVMESGCTQENVFSQVADLITSSLYGYDVSILAYGPTGTGKTYTMEGLLAQEDTMGIIPRAFKLVFQSAQEQKQYGWQFEFQVSCVEIYCEELRDLLAEGDKRGVNLEMFTSGDRAVVKDLTVVHVHDTDQVLAYLKKASLNRMTGDTKSNVVSSRSHAVCRLHLKGSNSKTGDQVESLLSLVDLAGSERLKESEAEGLRQTETKYINTSLSTLQLVIQKLSQKKASSGHVPYRNSKLTLLLKDSLGAGNSKTLMLVNLSPLQKNLEETQRTLEFAVQASQVHIGVANKNA